MRYTSIWKQQWIILKIFITFYKICSLHETFEINKIKHDQYQMKSKSYVRSGLSSLGVPQILADQLTLSQPRGIDYAHQIILAPQNFQTFRRPWYVLISVHDFQDCFRFRFRFWLFIVFRKPVLETVEGLKICGGLRSSHFMEQVFPCK